MNEPTFRWAQSDDKPQMFRVMSSAFNLLRGSSKWTQAQRLVDSQFANFRLMMLDNEVIGIAHLSRHPLQIGRSLIDLGYIGQISVAPEWQQVGMGSKFVRDLLREMLATGYDLARLSGLVRYYRRFGWTPFPRRFVEFPLQRLQTGTVEVSLSDMLEQKPEAVARIRDYRSESDRRKRDALLHKFNEHRTGASQAPRSARSTPFTTELPRRWQIVYEEEGQILGYLASHVFGEDISEFEASVNLREAAFELDRPEVVVAMIKHVLWEAHQRGARRVTARFPWDSRLFHILRGANLVFERVELFNDVTGNMLRVLDARALLSRIVGELHHRWSNRGFEAPPAAVLQIFVDETPVAIRLEPGKIDVLDSVAHAGGGEGSGHPTWSLQLTQYEFCSLILGLSSVEEVIPINRTTAASLRVLDALFPRQSTASTIWG